jgi:hypothetical protein
MIHKVRQEIDEEISRQGISPAQWVRAQGKIDVERLCQKLGLKNYKIVKDGIKARV